MHAGHCWKLKKLAEVGGFFFILLEEVYVKHFYLTRHSKYQEWMQGFDASACHLMLGITENEEEKRGFGSFANTNCISSIRNFPPPAFRLASGRRSRAEETCVRTVHQDLKKLCNMLFEAIKILFRPHWATIITDISCKALYVPPGEN